MPIAEKIKYQNKIYQQHQDYYSNNGKADFKPIVFFLRFHIALADLIYGLKRKICVLAFLIVSQRFLGRAASPKAAALRLF